ncbi:MAG TPA: hypothetical protein P5230_00220 [Candidatus Magasanikbacteria bacterium]|nr:hypothetical protein [Candidatus Magasanikbacteria bacterium]
MEKFCSLTGDIVGGCVIVFVIAVSLVIVTTPVIICRGGLEIFWFFQTKKYKAKQGSF